MKRFNHIFNLVSLFFILVTTNIAPAQQNSFSTESSQPDNNELPTNSQTTTNSIFAVTNTNTNIPLQSTVTPNTKQRASVAVVLAGGGARGFAHIPVLELLEELNIPIDIVIGTSAGAIIGGLYCSGYKPTEIEKALTHQNWAAIFRDQTSTPFEKALNEGSLATTPLAIKFSDGMSLSMGTGLFTGQKAYELFEDLTVKIPSQIDFDQLPIPFRAVTVDLFTGEQVVLSSGSVAEAIRASMSIPSLFEPFCIDGKYYIDGMAKNNFPIDIAKEMGYDVIIAVEMSTPLKNDYDDFRNNPFIALKQMLEMGVYMKGWNDYSLADIIIYPNFGDYSEIDYMSAPKIYELSKSEIDCYRDELLKLKEHIYSFNNVDNTTQNQVEIQSQNDTYDHTAHHVYNSQNYFKIEQLSINGAAKRDLKLINKQFNKLIKDKPLTQENLSTFLDVVYTTGNYSCVIPRIFPTGIQDDSCRLAIMELNFTEKQSDKTVLLLNGDFQGTLAMDSTTQFNASTDFQYRNLTGTGSILSAKLTFINDLALKFLYVQPLGPKAFLRFNCEYNNDNNYNGRGWEYKSITVTTNKKRTAELAFGFPFSIHHTVLVGGGIKFFDTRSALIKGGESFVGDFMTNYTLNTLNHTSFPTSGAYLSLLGIGVLPITTHKTVPIFEVVKVDATGVIPVGGYVSLVLHGLAGSNISQRLKLAPELLSIYGFSATDRIFFPQIATSCNYGLHKIVLGGAVQVSPWKQLTLLGGQAFFSVSGAVGKVWQDFETMQLSDLDWRASADAGIRIADKLSILLRVGAGTSCSKVRPFVSLDIGAIRN